MCGWNATFRICFDLLTYYLCLPLLFAVCPYQSGSDFALLQTSFLCAKASRLNSNTVQWSLMPSSKRAMNLSARDLHHKSKTSAFYSIIPPLAVLSYTNTLRQTSWPKGVALFRAQIAGRSVINFAGAHIFSLNVISISSSITGAPIRCDPPSWLQISSIFRALPDTWHLPLITNSGFGNFLRPHVPPVRLCHHEISWGPESVS